MENSDITLSEAAAKRIAQIVAADAGKQALRVSVEGGGCSGFSYKFDLAEDPADDDIVIARGDAKVLIDSLSVVYMAGSEIDFVDNLLGQSFQIKNPNAVASRSDDSIHHILAFTFQKRWQSLLHRVKVPSQKGNSDEDCHLEHQRRQGAHRKPLPVAEGFFA